MSQNLENDIYYQKYLKYKTKYLKLKNQSGGNPNFKLFYIPYGDDAIDKILANPPYSSTIITKPELLDYLQKISKCYSNNEIDPSKPLENICQYIYQSGNLTFGIRDISNESFGVIDVYFKGKSLIINWAVSDGGGKGRYLVEVVQHLAQTSGFKKMELTATPTSAPFWSHMGFISNLANPSHYYKDI
jgi:hypothetical protein